MIAPSSGRKHDGCNDDDSDDDDDDDDDGSDDDDDGDDDDDDDDALPRKHVFLTERTCDRLWSRYLILVELVPHKLR